MKHHLCQFLLILLLISWKESFAQTQELKFTKISGSDGVSLGKINGMTRDKYGFMWFSDQTNRCIVRYDGRHMVRYQYDAENPDGLGGYYPECLYADSTGIIWVGFYGQGLDKFNPDTNTFTHYDHDPDDPESLSHDFVTSILIDHLGNIWIGSQGGLDLMNPETGKFSNYSHNPGDSTSLSNNRVRALYEDSEGTLWVGTGMAFINDDLGGLNRFNRNTGTFTRYLHDPEDPQSLIDNKVRAIFEDSKGNFWIGTRDNGLHSMDRNTGLFKQHIYDPVNPKKLAAPPVRSQISHITFITEDADENLWIGTVDTGINRYDPVTKEITHFGNNADNSGSFMDNSAWWVHISNDGLLWMSTQESSLYQIDIFSNTISHTGGFDGVWGMYEESPTMLWIGTSSGLIRSDLRSETTKKFLHDPQNPNSLSNNEVNSILKDKQGVFWIGTSNGLNSYDPISQKFTRYHNDPGDTSSLTNNWIQRVYEDGESDLWIGTIGGGLERLNRKTGKFTHYRSNPGDPNSISTDLVNIIFEDNSGDLWIGLAGNGGLNKLNREIGKFEKYLPGLDISSHYIDAEGIIWVGTQNGLYRYDRESDSFYTSNEGNSGINVDAAIWSIIGDNEDNLWMGSSSGILKLNQMRDHFVLYGKDNGIIPESLRAGAVYNNRNGKLFFGNIFGHYSFYPERLKTIAGTSLLFFTNFWLDGELIIPAKDQPLRESLFNTNEIELEYDQNTFSIGFTAIEYRDPLYKNIYYTLINYDDDWRRSPMEDRASYFKVPYGTYSFRIKVARNTGGWEEKSIAIVINPPWWLTWWAYGVYGLFFITGVFFVDRFQRKRLLEKERAQAKEIELKQAKEIEKAYTELKITQSQLIQSEKMASLGELTAGIAHEIQNPLNFVNNFAEVSQELIVEMNEELDKEDIKEAKEIARDIEQNLDKINHHGMRASSIVKGMLEHSRTTDNQKVLTDINKLADEYLRLAYHGLRAKDKSFNANFTTDLDKTLPKINIILQDIGRVVLNLINNAFYAVSNKSKKGIEGFTPSVIISTRNNDKTLEISVKDNGDGIPKDVKDKIFQPFFTTKPTGEGTGLGLSLSYDIITKGHDGQLKVETKEGLGTEFTIILPNK